MKRGKEEVKFIEEHSQKEDAKNASGMLYIIVSFVPWIVYWILCGIGSMLGIIIPLIFSIVLISFQIIKQNFNLMDLASILYFSFSFICTFLLNSNIFLEKSGFLGYFALFLMASISIAIKQPYTLHVSKRGYPEVYWKDRSFLAINYVITSVWTGIFLLNAILFLFLQFSLAVIFSNALVAIGVLFSIIFPLRALTYFITREFKENDWKIKVNIERPKAEDEYDVIIVGSGIGGLVCGSLLSKRGYKVLVLEQHYQVGGYCSSFDRRGFVFNTGVEDVSGLWEKGPLTYLLKELGLRREEVFVRNTSEYIFKGKRIRAKSLEELIGILSEMFPDEEENIRAFFDEAKKAYEECYMEAEVYGVPLPAELIVKVFGGRKLLNYPREHPHLYNWINKNFKEKLDEHFKNEGLKEFLCALLGYIGTKPDKTPANSALTACISYYIHGGYFPKGGAQKFANSLNDFILNHGGKVLVNHKVDRILVEDGRAVGVKVGNKVFKAPIVVSNANAKTTFLELIEKGHLKEEFIEYIRGLKMSPSCFMVFLGVDMDLSNYPPLIKNIDESYDIVINSNADPNLAPKGKSSITILTLANYQDFPERGTDEYIRKKQEYSEVLIRKAEKVIPNLSKHIIVKDAATPKTFERYTSMPQGAIYSFDQSIGVKRPYFKTPIKGLYLVGASTFPGGGIEAVTISGIICAYDICNWKI